MDRSMRLVGEDSSPMTNWVIYSGIWQLLVYRVAPPSQVCFQQLSGRY